MGWGLEEGFEKAPSGGAPGDSGQWPAPRLGTRGLWARNQGSRHSQRQGSHASSASGASASQVRVRGRAPDPPTCEPTLWAKVSRTSTP